MAIDPVTGADTEATVQNVHTESNNVSERVMEEEQQRLEPQDAVDVEISDQARYLQAQEQQNQSVQPENVNTTSTADTSDEATLNAVG